MLTFGHGRLGRDELTALLQDAGVELVVDVRRFPGSRRNSAAARDELPPLLAEAGIDYRWEERLGGRRSLTKEERAQSPDGWWRVAAFRAYAGWTRTPEFRAALDDLLEDDATRSTAIMCSESVWWRCHRRLISDVVLLESGRDVGHLMHSGKVTPHPPSEGARRGDDGQLVWDRSSE